MDDAPQKIAVGDRIKFRALTRYSSRALLRTVREVMPSGTVSVAAHGYDDFMVKPEEIIAHFPATATV